MSESRILHDAQKTTLGARQVDCKAREKTSQAAYDMDPVVVRLEKKLVSLIDNEILEVLNVKHRVVFDLLH